MQRNMSDSERWVRSVLGALAVFFGVITLSTTGWSTVAWFVGGGLLLTGVAGYCPVYDLFGYSTVETGENDPNRW